MWACAHGWELTNHDGHVLVVDAVVIDRRLEEMAILLEPGWEGVNAAHSKILHTR